MRARLIRSSLILVLVLPALAILVSGQRAPSSIPLHAGEPSLPGPASEAPKSPAAFPSPTPEPVRSGVEVEVEDLRNELEHILASTGNRTGKWSVLAVSLDRGDTLLSMNPREPMVPASNMKVFTTAAALHSLGPDFRYTTFLLTTGKEEGSLLQGDLILYGTGDPTFSDRFFPGRTAALDSLAGMIRRRGIQEIRGDLIIDGSYFRGPEIHPEWDPRDLNDHFAAPVAAVGFNENLVRVQVVANRMVGRPPEIRLIPSDAGVPILNIARTVPAGSRSRIWLFRDSPWDPIGIEGEIPLGGRDVWRELPVPDPLVFTGRVLRCGSWATSGSSGLP